MVCNMKYCPKCTRTLDLSGFYKNKSRVDGLQGYCKECKKKRDRQYDAEHREEVNKYAREQRSRSKNYLSHLKKYREKSKPIRAKIQMKRKTSKLQRMPKWLTEFDLLKIKCYYQVAAMYSKESGFDWHVDHVIPLQGKNVSGLHVPSNLQIIPAIENMRKNNHYEVEHGNR